MRIYASKKLFLGKERKGKERKGKGREGKGGRKEEDCCGVTTNDRGAAELVREKGSSIFISCTRPIRVSRIQGVSSINSFSLPLFFSLFMRSGCGTAHTRRKPLARHRILRVTCTYARAYSSIYTTAFYIHAVISRYYFHVVVCVSR